MSTRTRKPASERKAEIVDTAIKMAAIVGPDRLTTEKLAREIGISQPAIFRHFPSKTNIWEAVGERICTLMGESLRQDIPNDPQARLTHIVTAQLAFIQKTPAVPAILFSRELHAENEPLRKVFASLMAARHARISELVAQGISTGVFKENLDSDDAAYLVLTLIQGLAMRWSLNKQNFDLLAEGKRLLALQMTAFKA
ncbi:MAG: TetR/AcrR family transcriptional regulator [Paracoccaceae bacterium]